MHIYRMLLVLFLLTFVGGAVPAVAAPRLQQAPQIASYQMQVQLDPAAKTVTGSERIMYRNPSQDTLNEVWLRLYLKAFSRLDTVWMRESGKSHRGYELSDTELGDITVHTLSSGGTDLLSSATITDTLMRVSLPQPLAPGAQLDFDITWTSKLPRVFARTGYGGLNDTFFMVGQWYPKMAVYDNGRWDTEPWHVNSEFFNDFGSYDVRITVPQNYVVAGAGVPAGEQPNADGSKTLHYTSTDVTDYAFAASPDFRTRSAKAGDVDVVLYYLPEHASVVDEYMAVSAGSLEAYSTWYGPYPHQRLTVVDVPSDAGGAGGMEYPTLVTGGDIGLPVEGAVGIVVSHEVGHQWWPMQTATNEGREPWLDEGITEYSGLRYMVEADRRLQVGPLSSSTLLIDRSQYAADPNEPATKSAWEYDSTAYGATVYSKTALGLWTLENVVGTPRFRQAMASYLRQYRFKHPTGADFRATLEESLGGDLTWFFDGYMNTGGQIDYAVDPLDSGSSTATVRRVGSVPAPVEVRVTLASGAVETRTWDGQSDTMTFSFPGSTITRIEVDPDHKLVAELDLVNNGATAAIEVKPTLTLAGRLLFWIQSFLEAFGLFG